MANKNDWMKYRANRQPQQDPSLLESYGEAHMSFFRKYMEMKDPRVPGKVAPNYNFGPIIEDAARISEKIVRATAIPLHLHLHLHLKH
jgi:hypothetical protein